MSFALSQDKKVALIFRLTLFFWLVTKIISHRLWLGDHIFPTAPIFGFLPQYSSLLNSFLFVSSCFLVLYLLFRPRSYYLITVLLAVEILQLLPDQNRWQPYIFQFIFTAIAFLLSRGNTKRFIYTIVFFYSCMYLHAGLHKLNGGFLYLVWERMILNRFLGMSFSEINNPIIHYSGLMLGFIEFVAGFGLLFARKKMIYAFILTLMHIFIIVVISPIGINYNMVVWPWNILMICVLPLLFIPASMEFDFTFKWNEPKTIFLSVLFLLLPFLSYFGIYDNYLAFNLYSGKGKIFEICIDKPTEAPELLAFKSNNSKVFKNKTTVKANSWHLLETQTLVYPEERVYKQIADSLKKRYPKAELSFCIYQYPYKVENTIYFK
jgi:hypothetical protein